MSRRTSLKTRDGQTGHKAEFVVKPLVKMLRQNAEAIRIHDLDVAALPARPRAKDMIRRQQLVLSVATSSTHLASRSKEASKAPSEARSKRSIEEEEEAISSSVYRMSSPRNCSSGLVKLAKNRKLFKMLNCSTKDCFACNGKMSLIGFVQRNLNTKYLTKRETYYLKVVNDIIYNESTHVVSVFKDYLVYDDKTEFLRRFYTTREASHRLPKVCGFYFTTTKFFPNYVMLHERKYMFKNIERRQKLLNERGRKTGQDNPRSRPLDKLESGLEEDNRIFTTNFVSELNRPSDSGSGSSDPDRHETTQILDTQIQTYAKSQAQRPNKEPRVDQLTLPELVDKFIVKDSHSSLYPNAGVLEMSSRLAPHDDDIPSDAENPVPIKPIGCKKPIPESGIQDKQISIKIDIKAIQEQVAHCKKRSAAAAKGNKDTTAGQQSSRATTTRAESTTKSSSRNTLVQHAKEAAATVQKRNPLIGPSATRPANIKSKRQSAIVPTSLSGTLTARPVSSATAAASAYGSHKPSTCHHPQQQKAKPTTRARSECKELVFESRNMVAPLTAQPHFKGEAWAEKSNSNQEKLVLHSHKLSSPVTTPRTELLSTRNSKLGTKKVVGKHYKTNSCVPPGMLSTVRLEKPHEKNVVLRGPAHVSRTPMIGTGATAGQYFSTKPGSTKNCNLPLNKLCPVSSTRPQSHCAGGTFRADDNKKPARKSKVDFDAAKLVSPGACGRHKTVAGTGNANNKHADTTGKKFRSEYLNALTNPRAPVAGLKPIHVKQQDAEQLQAEIAEVLAYSRSVGKLEKAKPRTGGEHEYATLAEKGHCRRKAK